MCFIPDSCHLFQKNGVSGIIAESSTNLTACALFHSNIFIKPCAFIIKSNVLFQCAIFIA